MTHRFGFRISIFRFQFNHAYFPYYSSILADRRMAMEIFVLGEDAPMDHSGDHDPLGPCRPHSVETTQRVAGSLHPSGWATFERRRCLSIRGWLFLSAVHGLAGHSVYRLSRDGISDGMV